MGQFVSTRSDIFDKEIINELQTLQDKAPPFSAADAKRIISRELKRPYDEVFTNFKDKPLASASISQVHRAKLISNNKEVVIKVRRPYIRNYFDRDFTTLQMIFEFASMFNNRSIQDSKLLLNDCYKYLYEELCFENELLNLQRFENILKYDGDIIIPEVYPEFSTSKIITMEYVPSTKIGNVAGVDRSHLATVLMECFIKQILEHGVIHADPHPGNIGITADGRIVLYDFGQVIALDEVFVKNVKPLLFSVYERDVDSVAEIMIKTKTIVLTRSLDKKVTRSFVAKIIQYFETVDFKEFQLDMINSDFEDMDMPFKVNSKLVMVFRSLSLLEGICKELDSEFSYFKVINTIMSEVFFDMDYIDHRARKDLTSLFEVNPNEQMTTLQSTIDDNNKKQTKQLNSTLTQYQYMMGGLLLMNVWDIENIPRSMAFAGALFYFLFKIK